MPFKYIEVRESTMNTLIGENDTDYEMSLLICADGTEFAVLSSFLEQEAGVLRSPYSDCECVFWDEEENEYKRNNGDIADHREIEYVFEEDRKIEKPITDALEAVTIIEDASTSYERTREAFQYLYTSGMHTHLQGSYQRTINTMLAHGDIS